MKRLKKLNFELIFWIVAILALAVSYSNNNAYHFTLCPIANLGFESWCPGCGLGRSISSILHGQLTQSFKQHWFGLPALAIILFRIYTLINNKGLGLIKNKN